MPVPNAPAVHAIEPLAKHHKREGFSCGIDALDRYLKHQASQDARRRMAAPRVAVTTDGTVIAYYTLSAYSLAMASLPETERQRLPHYAEVPATLIGRLAVDQSHAGQGLGSFTLTYAVKRALAASAEVASYAVVVDAKNANALRFYQANAFTLLAGTENRLYLPMKEAARLHGT